MKDEIIIYQANQASTRIEVRVDDNTVWLSQEQIASLFGRNRVSITQHIGNIFKEKELIKEVVCKEFLLTTQHGAILGKTQINKIILYNLDVIISVGYRVKSKEGTQFKTNLPPNQGVFFNGQVFDAYVFFSEIIKNAQTEIILIDNYIELEKHNKQYPPIEIKPFTNSHDRFIIIDQKELYHLGASLKDLGKKWFGFSRMDSLTGSLLNMLKE